LVIGVDLRPQNSDPEPTQLMHAIRQNFDQTSSGHGAVAGLAFMVFVLIYTPCVATVTAERQELGAKWMWISLAGQLVLAWLMAFAVFQIGLQIMG
jgi:ferrous iron transport protein B